MADILESDSTNVQLSKAEINNHPPTTTMNDGLPEDDHSSRIHSLETITSSEQSDLLRNGTNENTSDNHDEPGLSSTSDNDNTSASKTELSRNPYHDFSGVDTESFITNTLRHNAKDRQLLLTLEKLFQEFIQNNEQDSHQFQAMNSYERMIVHRVAAFFGLDHNVDKNGQSIIVSKTSNTRIPNISFENFIPSEELSPDPENNTNSSIENPIRRQTYRFPKAFNQSTVNPSKTFFERTDQSGEKLSNKFNRKQRFNTNHHVPHAHLQQANQLINMRTQPMYPAVSNAYYPQQQSMSHDFKQQSAGSTMYNYVPMVSLASYQQGNGIQLPILLHQQPTGQIRYAFPSRSLPTAPILSSDGQCMPIYRSDGMAPVVDNNLYSQPTYTHLYPSPSYPHPQQTGYIQPAPSFVMPSNDSAAIHYATNQLAAMNLQSQPDNSVKSFVSNGMNSSANHHHHQYHQQHHHHHRQARQTRPLNTYHIDKTVPPMENELKSTDPTLLPGSNIEKD